MDFLDPGSSSLFHDVVHKNGSPRTFCGKQDSSQHMILPNAAFNATEPPLLFGYVKTFENSQVTDAAVNHVAPHLPLQSTYAQLPLEFFPSSSLQTYQSVEMSFRSFQQITHQPLFLHSNLPNPQVSVHDPSQISLTSPATPCCSDSRPATSLVTDKWGIYYARDLLFGRDNREVKSSGSKTRIPNHRPSHSDKHCKLDELVSMSCTPISAHFPCVCPVPVHYKPSLRKRVSPETVDTSVPFTTYLQRLAKTLRQSAGRKLMSDTTGPKQNAEYSERKFKLDSYSQISDNRDKSDATGLIISGKKRRCNDEINANFIKAIDEDQTSAQESHIKAHAHEGQVTIQQKPPLLSRFDKNPTSAIASCASDNSRTSLPTLSPSIPNAGTSLQHQRQQRKIGDLSDPSLLFGLDHDRCSVAPEHSSKWFSPAINHEMSFASSQPVHLSSTVQGYHPVVPEPDGGSMCQPSQDKQLHDKKYKCDVCQKTFSRSNTLLTHKRIHTGDKPFKCEVCGRAFRQPGNLTRHRLTHTAYKPYVCYVCSKAFNRASNLNTHMRTHRTFQHFTTPWVCPKSFWPKAV